MSTRGNLQPAKISSMDGSIVVECMFNPDTYTVSYSNTYTSSSNSGVPTAKKQKGSKTPEVRVPPQVKFSSYGRPSLTLPDLLFDTYETPSKDLTETIEKLEKFMSPSDGKYDNPATEPPEVKFEWSKFSFQAFITSLKITYTMFDKDGTPVRAKVNMTFMESTDYKNKKQNPTSGGGPIEEIREVTAGDRLDLIAADIYGDSTKWRLIADRNGITDPRTLRPGQKLTIPSR